MCRKGFRFLVLAGVVSKSGFSAVPGDRWFAWDDEGSWREILTVDPLAFESPFRPAGYGSDLDRLFNIAWDPEAEASGLYRQTLMGEDSERTNERVFSRAGVDIELVDTMGPHQRVVAAAFLEGTPRRAIVDPRVAAVYQSVAALLPTPSRGSEWSNGARIHAISGHSPVASLYT